MVREFSASVKQIKNILRTEGKLYSIPRYQRGYAWTRSQYDAFWNDLHEEDWELFIGTILLNSDDSQDQIEERVEVIDGQQRLLTITILLASIRDALDSLDFKREAAGLQDHYIATQEWAGDENQKPIILPGDKLKNYFKSEIQQYPVKRDYPNMEAKNDEEKRVRSAKSYFDRAIKNELKNISDSMEKMKWLTSTAKRIEKLTVVAIDVEQEEDAYIVFDSVNAKGTALTLADILKNMIFRQIQNKKGEEDTAKSQWNTILANLDGTGFSMSRFIRYYWLSKHEFLTESKLYEAIKKKLQRRKVDWQALLDDLVQDSHRLKKLRIADIEDFSDFKSPRRIFSSLRGISTMNVSQVYVLLLSMHRNRIIKKKWEREYEFLEKFCFNYHAISKLQAVRVEKKYSEYARAIEEVSKIENSEDKSTELEKILRKMIAELSELKHNFVNEENFIIGFSRELVYSTSITKRRLVSYSLLKINDYMTGGTGELTIDQAMVNMEHVLPQNPEQWGYEKRQVEEYVNLIGNITLLSKKLNSKIGNKSLDEKMPHLSESELEITKRLVSSIEKNGKTWNKQSIISRTDELGKISFAEIWNI